MSVHCGIAGLPNVGKSTLFNALTAASAAVENRPFCTVDPNRAIANVPDERLDRLVKLYSPERVRSATLEFVDIAGLVEGASRGEGLGNAFLSQIREVDALVHVVRCFNLPAISHQYGHVDPVRDVEVVRTELMLKDLETVERRLEKARHSAKVGQKEVRAQLPLLEKFLGKLAAGNSITAENEEERALIAELFLLTSIPVVYVGNVAEAEFGSQVEPLHRLREYAASRGEPVIEVAVKTEAELAELPPDDRDLFAQELGIGAGGSLARLVRVVYDMLGLVTFFTVVGVEVSAWSIPKGTVAAQAAGRIHSQMEKGFIKADVVPWATLIELGSEQAVRDRGLLATEGKDYVVQDGDVMRIRFRS